MTFIAKASRSKGLQGSIFRSLQGQDEGFREEMKDFTDFTEHHVSIIQMNTHTHTFKRNGSSDSSPLA